MSLITGNITEKGRFEFKHKHRKFQGKVEILNDKGDFRAKIKPRLKNITKTQSLDINKEIVDCGCVIVEDENKIYIDTSNCQHGDDCSHILDKTLGCGCVIKCENGEIIQDDTNCILKQTEFKCGCKIEFDQTTNRYFISYCDHDETCNHEKCSHKCPIINTELECGCVIEVKKNEDNTITYKIITTCKIHTNSQALEFECGCEFEILEKDDTKYLKIITICDKHKSHTCDKCKHTCTYDIDSDTWACDCENGKYNTVVKFNDNCEIDIPTDVSSISLGDNYYGTTYDDVCNIVANTNQSKNIISELYILDSANIDKISEYSFNRQNINNKNNYHLIETLHLPESLTQIGAHAFNSTADLTSLIIPNLVKSIGEYAFNACNNLKQLSLSSSLESISNNCFAGCGVLESLIIPSSVTSIGQNAFNGCSKLTSLVLSNGLGYIGQYAFNKCNVLKSLIIPSSVTDIGQYAFSGCNELTSLIFEESSNKELTIGQYAFSGCNELKKVVIPKSVSSFGPYTFENCNKLEEVHVLRRYYGSEQNDVSPFYGAYNNLNKIVISDSSLTIDVTNGNRFNCIFEQKTKGGIKEEYSKNITIQISGLDIKNIESTNDTYIKNTETLAGFLASNLYYEFESIFGENKLKKTPHQTEKSYRHKFVDMYGVDIIDYFGHVKLDSYSTYRLINDEKLYYNKFVNIMHTVANEIETLTLHSDDDTWNKLSTSSPKRFSFGNYKPENLETIELSPNINTFDASAFANLSKVEKITTAKNTENPDSNVNEISIPNSLCKDCVNLTEFRLDLESNKITYSSDVFNGCSNLVTIAIPNLFEFCKSSGSLLNCASLSTIYTTHDYSGTGCGYNPWYNTYDKKTYNPLPENSTLTIQLMNVTEKNYENKLEDFVEYYSQFTLRYNYTKQKDDVWTYLNYTGVTPINIILCDASGKLMHDYKYSITENEYKESMPENE